MTIDTRIDAPAGKIGKHGVRYGVSLRVTDDSIDMVTLATHAEALGFESLWLPEHTLPVELEQPIVDPEVYRHSVDQLIALANAAGATKTIKLGTGVCLVPEHHPVRLAREIATLDYLSGGRFQLGVGTGYVKEELSLFGVDIEHRWTQTRETIEAMKLLWGDDPAEYHGRYVDFPAIDMRPKPMQRPRPPIYLGSRNPNVFKRIVAHADGWIPHAWDTVDLFRTGRLELDRLATEAGRDPRSIEVIAFGLYPKDIDQIPAYLDAGADRVVFRFETTPRDEALEQLDRVAEQVFA